MNLYVHGTNLSYTLVKFKQLFVFTDTPCTLWTNELIYICIIYPKYVEDPIFIFYWNRLPSEPQLIQSNCIYPLIQACSFRAPKWKRGDVAYFQGLCKVGCLYIEGALPYLLAGTRRNGSCCRWPLAFLFPLTPTGSSHYVLQ